MSADRLTLTEYTDPVTSERRTIITCPEHDQRLLRVLRSEGIGCLSTYAPSLASCTPCSNERKDKS